MKQLKERRRSLGLKKFFKLSLLTILVSCSAENKPEVNYAEEFKSILAAFESSSILDLENSYFEKEDFLEAYLDQLDSQKNYFSQNDVSLIKDFNEENKDIFLTLNLATNSFYNIYEESLRVRKSLLNKHKFDFEKIEYVGLENRVDYFINEDERKDFYRKIVKNELLNLLIEDENFNEAKNILNKRYSDRISYIKKTRSEDKFSVLANNFLSLIDPHATYFSDRDLDDWNLRMNLSFEGIGAVLSYKNETARIEELMSGGPALKSKEINVGDKVLAVGQGKKGKLTNVIGWRLDDIVEIIRGEEGSFVRLKIENENEKKIVTLERGQIILEESDVSSEIINYGGKNLGYIKVPSFYSDIECFRNQGFSCKSVSYDVRDSLLEFNRKDINGIVIDLRNNSGGYLHEADQLTRLFIDYGPTVQVKGTEDDVDVYTAWRSIKTWNKPMIVLVNKFSASASEIFAGAIQDYNRGLIIGQNTFGKGSVQGFKKTNLGQIKLTESLYYRVTGKPTQIFGVQPNLEIPTLLDVEEFGESKYSAAIKPTTISEAAFFKKTAINESKYKKILDQNIAESSYFQSLSDIKKSRGAQKTKLSLNLEERKQIYKDNRANSLKLVNQRRSLSNLEPFASYEDFENFIDDEDFEIDAEIDQSAKILYEIIEAKI
ncbi:MAG: carboxy terminal-processing peptidase [Pseudomonadota bacterium]|nr:carboxy terminal-processing peptidase [Pseudomonadota bacterium]